MSNNFLPETYTGEWVFRQDINEWTFAFPTDSSGMWETETYSEAGGYEFKRSILKPKNKIDELPNFMLTSQGKNSKYTFHIDGLPHQGNTTLRNLMINIFDQINIPEPLRHNTDITQQAIIDNEIVILSLRDPYETIASLFSEHLQREENKLELHNFLSNRQINFYQLTRVINYYNRWTGFIVKNHENIHILSFEAIKQMYSDYQNINIENNKIVQYLSKNYELNIFKHQPKNFMIKSSVIKNVLIYFKQNSAIDSFLAPAVILYNQAKNLEGSYDR